AKQRKIIKTTAAFLQAHPQFDNFDIRFDVVSYEGAATAGQAVMPMPTWIKDAFSVN
ncbi:MAG: YraN family protein, partial [Moraxella osloensis]|nr:YraN family protein [Moraxella osloensis]